MLVDSIPWETVQGYSLAQVLHIQALSPKGARGAMGEVGPSPHVYIDSIKLAESFEFYEPERIQVCPSLSLSHYCLIVMVVVMMMMMILT